MDPPDFNYVGKGAELIDCFFTKGAVNKRARRGNHKKQTEKQAPEIAWISTEQIAFGQHKLS